VHKFAATVCLALASYPRLGAFPKKSLSSEPKLPETSLPVKSWKLQHGSSDMQSKELDHPSTILCVLQKNSEALCITKTSPRVFSCEHVRFNQQGMFQIQRCTVYAWVSKFSLSGRFSCDTFSSTSYGNNDASSRETREPQEISTDHIRLAETLENDAVETITNACMVNVKWIYASTCFVR
jgi:hypothetical protein